MSRQWHYAPSGHRVGLRVEAMDYAMRRAAVRPEQRDEVESGVATLEAEWVEVQFRGQ